MEHHPRILKPDGEHMTKDALTQADPGSMPTFGLLSDQPWATAEKRKRGRPRKVRLVRGRGKPKVWTPAQWAELVAICRSIEREMEGNSLRSSRRVASAGIAAEIKRLAGEKQHRGLLDDAPERPTPRLQALLTARRQHSAWSWGTWETGPDLLRYLAMMSTETKNSSLRRLIDRARKAR